MNTAGLTPRKQVVVCPDIDNLIAKCTECHQGLPKAVLPDTDDPDVRGRFGQGNITGIENWRAAAEKERGFGKKFCLLKYDSYINL